MALIHQSMRQVNDHGLELSVFAHDDQFGTSHPVQLTLAAKGSTQTTFLSVEGARFCRDQLDAAIRAVESAQKVAA